MLCRCRALARPVHPPVHHHLHYNRSAIPPNFSVIAFARALLSQTSAPSPGRLSWPPHLLRHDMLRKTAPRLRRSFPGPLHALVFGRIRRPALFFAPFLLPHAGPSSFPRGRHGRCLRPREIHPRIQTTHRICLPPLKLPATLANEILRPYLAQSGGHRGCGLLHPDEPGSPGALHRPASLSFVRLPNNRLDEAQPCQYRVAASLEKKTAGLKPGLYIRRPYLPSYCAASPAELVSDYVGWIM